MINDPRLVRILYFHSGANALIGEHLQWRIPLLGDQKNMVVFVKIIYSACTITYPGLNITLIHK